MTGSSENRSLARGGGARALASAVAGMALGLSLVAAPMARAQEQEAAGPALALELNALQPADNGCRITFLITNGLGAKLDLATAEIALFNTDRAIERIVRLDFKELAEGKSKVLQFSVPNLDCARIGRLLINDITACQGEGIAPTACLDTIRTTTVPDVAFGV